MRVKNKLNSSSWPLLRLSNNFDDYKGQLGIFCSVFLVVLLCIRSVEQVFFIRVLEKDISFLSRGKKWQDFFEEFHCWLVNWTIWNFLQNSRRHLVSSKVTDRIEMQLIFSSGQSLYENTWTRHRRIKNKFWKGHSKFA